MTHNISINVTAAESPAARRKHHLRSLSDVTPAARAAAPRARSHSERSRPSSPASPPPAPPPPPPPPAPRPALSPPPPARRAHSERSSPSASLVSVDCTRSDTEEPRARHAHRARGDSATLGNPWRKMSEADLVNGNRRARHAQRSSLDKSNANDPWIKSSTLRPVKEVSPRERGGGGALRAALSVGGVESASKRDVGVRRGKLERKSPVVCDTCGNESCECWRPRSPRCPRTPRTPRLSDPRQKRALSSPGAASAAYEASLCTCEAPRSARVSPARATPAPLATAPVPTPLGASDRCRSLSQQLEAPRCADQKDPVQKVADPLLETTC